VRPGAAYDEASVLAHAHARMARYKVPARVQPLAAFPTVQSANAIKVQKTRLREIAQALALDRGDAQPR
jgi:fatty-acyl-CoA synthase